MKYLKERIKHAVRFRHKRGYGVHSPFMFNLILNVIRDREKQFVYPEMLEKEGRLTHRRKKVFRLLSRLTRYLSVSDIACFGGDAELLCRYLSQVTEQTGFSVNDPTKIGTCDFIYIGRNSRSFLSVENLLSLLCDNKERRCIVITDIYKDPFQGRLWRQLCNKATVSVDMMWYGIVFFDDKIQRGKYNLII